MSQKQDDTKNPEKCGTKRSPGEVDKKRNPQKGDIGESAKQDGKNKSPRKYDIGQNPDKEGKKRSPQKCDIGKNPPKCDKEKSPPKCDKEKSPPKYDIEKSPQKDSKKKSTEKNTKMSPGKDDKKRSPEKCDKEYNPPKCDKEKSPTKYEKKKSPGKDGRNRSLEKYDREQSPKKHVTPKSPEKCDQKKSPEKDYIKMSLEKFTKISPEKETKKSPEKDTKSPEKDDTFSCPKKDGKKKSPQKRDTGTSPQKGTTNSPQKYDSKTRPHVPGNRTRDQSREDQTHGPLELSVVTQWIEEMGSKETREHAMEQLVAHQHLIPNLAHILSRSEQALYGAMLDIFMCNFLMNPPAGLPGVTPRQAVNATNAINLFKLVAVDPEGHQAFIESNLIDYFKAFIKSEDKSYVFQNLRMAAINLVVDLVKLDSPDMLSCLVSSNIVDCLISLLITECDTCKRGATYVIGKHLAVHQGLHHICSDPLKVLPTVCCLNATVIRLAHTDSPDLELLENVLYCYRLLASEARALQTIKSILPQEMVNGDIQRLLKTDTKAALYFSQFIELLTSEQA